MAMSAAIPTRRLIHALAPRRGLINPAFAKQQQRCITSIALSRNHQLVHRQPTSSFSLPLSNNQSHPTTTSQSFTAAHRQFSSMSSPPNKPEVHGLFHNGTSTMTYVIADPTTKETIILDSVLDYDASSGRTSNAHGEAVVQYCAENDLDVRYILESHVHGEN